MTGTGWAGITLLGWAGLSPVYGRRLASRYWAVLGWGSCRLRLEVSVTLLCFVRLSSLYRAWPG